MCLMDRSAMSGHLPFRLGLIRQPDQSFAQRVPWSSTLLDTVDGGLGCADGGGNSGLGPLLAQEQVNGIGWAHGSRAYTCSHRTSMRLRVGVYGAMHRMMQI